MRLVPTNHIVFGVGFSAWAPAGGRGWQHVTVLGSYAENRRNESAFRAPQELADQIKAGRRVYLVGGRPLQVARRPVGATWYPGGVMPQGTDFVFLPDEPPPPDVEVPEQLVLPWRGRTREPVPHNLLAELEEFDAWMGNDYDVLPNPAVKP